MILLQLRQRRHSWAAATTIKLVALSAVSLSFLSFLSSSLSSRRHAFSVWAFQPPLVFLANPHQHTLCCYCGCCRQLSNNAVTTSNNARKQPLLGGGITRTTSAFALSTTSWPSSSTARMATSSSSSTSSSSLSLDQQNVTSSSSSFFHQDELQDNSSTATPSIPPILQKLIDKVGKIDESRIISSPEYLNGDVPKLFSNLQYETTTIITTTADINTAVQQSLHQHLSNQSQQSESIQSAAATTTTTTTTTTDPEDGVTATKTIVITKAKPVETNLLSSSALLCGTALGCGLLNLPTAIYSSSAGYLPTLVATFVAWAYMTITALLTSELLINRYGETGRVRNVGLLELYDSYLGGGGGGSKHEVFTGLGGKVASLGFLIVSYVVMGIYLSEGGDQFMKIMNMVTNAATTASSSIGGTATVMNHQAPFANYEIRNAWLARALFASTMGVFLSTAAKFNVVQRAMTNVFVPMTLLSFFGAICIGLPTADFESLTALRNQHPEFVLNVFPLLFMSWTYHGVVPRVVYDLEGDKNKITLAIVIGSTTALLMYLTWNAMILGNIFGSGGVDLVDSLASSADGIVTTIEELSSTVIGDSMMGGQVDNGGLAVIAATSNSAAPMLYTTQFQPLLQSSIAIVSELAVITSLIGVVLGFVNEFNDAVVRISSVPSNSLTQPNDNDETKWKVALLTLLPPAVVSVALGYFSDGTTHVSNYQILDHTGIFGSSILFLILPALMVWQNRYGEGDPPRPLTVRPMVPLGKIPLGSLYKAAGTLIVEQGLEKLGVFEFVKEHISWKIE